MIPWTDKKSWFKPRTLLCTKIYFRMLVCQKAGTIEILIFIYFYGWGWISYNNVLFFWNFSMWAKIGFVILGQKLPFYKSCISEKIHSRVFLIWHLNILHVKIGYKKVWILPAEMVPKTKISKEAFLFVVFMFSLEIPFQRAKHIPMYYIQGDYKVFIQFECEFVANWFIWIKTAGNCKF